MTDSESDTDGPSDLRATICNSNELKRAADFGIHTSTDDQTQPKVVGLPNAISP